MKQSMTYPFQRLESLLTVNQISQLRLRDDITGPIIEWLKSRSTELQRQEDMSGQWGDECATHMHVRAMKGARMDCDDIRIDLESIINQKTNT